MVLDHLTEEGHCCPKLFQLTIVCLLVLRWKRGRELVHCLYKNSRLSESCVCHLEQLHAQSPFLFPIVFSINLIPFFDICSVDYLLFFHPGCSGMCCFTWAAARSQQYTLLFVVLAAGILWFAAGCHVRDASAGSSWMDHARPSSNVMHGACEDARTQSRRACANTLLYFSCLKRVNEIPVVVYWVNHGRLTSESKASASHRHSSITRPCCSIAQAPSAPSFLSLQSCTRTLDRLWTRRRAKLLVFTERVTIMHWNTRQALNASTRQASCLHWTRRSAKVLVFTIMHSNTRQAVRVDAFGLREMVLGKSRQAHQRTIMHSNTRQAANNALEHSTGSERVDAFGLREMVLGKSRQAHQRTAGSPANAKLTFRYPSSLINHSTLLLERSSAKLLVFYASTRSRRAVEVGRAQRGPFSYRANVAVVTHDV